MLQNRMNEEVNAIEKIVFKYSALIKYNGYLSRLQSSSDLKIRKIYINEIYTSSLKAFKLDQYLEL